MFDHTPLWKFVWRQMVGPVTPSAKNCLHQPAGCTGSSILLDSANHHAIVKIEIA